MNSNNFRMPARRLAAVATVTALTAAPAVLGAGAAHASIGHGRASAVVLRTGLDVSLLSKTVHVPLAVSLNEVQAPQSADRTTLTARLDGVAGGKPFTVARADVARSRATVTARRAEGSVRLVHAKVHVPGLPLLSLIEVDTVTAKATCEAGKAPVASANVLGAVTVLGKRVTLTAGGPAEVKVPGVGKVRLDLSQRRTTTRTAAATALRLKVSVNPLKLNVADVEGTVTLARATCESPAAPHGKHSAPSQDPAGDVRPQGAPGDEANLAETGGSSATPYIAGGALALLLAGGGAVVVARRRRS
ncbi:LPXTG cell wall anchor domain-containing protein [Streptomyces lucensis JCM 4490]|uniref:LPXTG cell wall anchor domain-containing protein n=1 Tax=Streptomyces lucensis JCM 4490 TaxID=1306176 RepID=A0A918JFN7_9ACTN|nr:SCO1860 family LAETG-anchored protein [Streptomyces lucensis]GGW73353.1 LPXTG cell wall anchor domain-containing protein [Streptomyces lucensis JCM 4490]